MEIGRKKFYELQLFKLALYNVIDYRGVKADSLLPAVLVRFYINTVLQMDFGCKLTTIRLFFLLLINLSLMGTLLKVNVHKMFT